MLLSPEELAIVSDELPVAIWMGRVPSGEVVYTNRAFREVLGVEAPAGAGRGEFVVPYGVHLPDGQPYPEHLMPFERAIAARATVVVDDIVIHRRDGRHVYLRVFAKPVFDAAGTITHVLEAFTDITREVDSERARVESERKLSRSLRLESIGQLVMGIAHDFNNLLTVTTLTTSRLLGSSRDPEVRLGLADIETVTSSAIALVKKLMSFATRSAQPLAAVELGAVARSVVAISERTLDRRLALTADCGTESTWIRGDQAQLEQVLMNLLVNARDAIDGTGAITVTTRVRALAAGEVETCPAGTYVVLEVTDDGAGIQPAIRDRIFEPYFSTKTRGPIKGTGLGLSTVLGIVRTHGGFIEAVPVAPHGTTMRLALRSYEHGAETAPTARPTETEDVAVVSGRGELILVIDDEPLVRAATARTLQSLGYRVVEAGTGREAVEVFGRRAREIAVVMLDMVIPGMSAREIYGALQATRDDVPVVVVTGSAMNDELGALLESGVRTWLAKPFEIAKLSEIMHALVQ
ncbi:MAG: response regulator [Deltaproteobacteria bacterium]|nr:response regulator [Deltaproteobacteria bacterium]